MIRAEDDLPSNQFVITPETFSVDELRSIARFDSVPELFFDLCVHVENDIEAVGSAVVSKMMESRSFVWTVASGSKKAKVYLETVERFGFVERLSETEESCIWRLTQSGEAAIQTSDSLVRDPAI